MYTVAERPIKLIIFFLVFHTVVFAKDHFAMKNPKGKTVELRLAISKEDQMKGLSGLKSKDFKNNQGMLFINPEVSPRIFWMINTYFNLDIIFLSKDLKIVGIEKNVPAHQGSKEPPAIYRTKTYQAQFVLETKAESPFSKDLKENDQLQFMGKPTLLEIIQDTHQKQ